MKTTIKLIAFLFVFLFSAVALGQTPEAVNSTELSVWLKLLMEVSPTLVSMILVPLLLWASRKLSTYLDKKGQDSALFRALSVVTTVTSGVVADLAQNTANVIKEAAKDGKLTEAERVLIKETALADVKKLIDLETWGVLVSTFGESKANHLIENEIEKNVVALKAVNSVTPKKVEDSVDKEKDSGN